MRSRGSLSVTSPADGVPSTPVARRDRADAARRAPRPLVAAGFRPRAHAVNFETARQQETRMRAPVRVALALLTLPGASVALAQAVPTQEWEVPWKNSRPRDPMVAPNGHVWFVGQTGNYVATLDPRSGQFKCYEVAENTNPHNVVVDRRGNAWFTGNRNGTIGRVDAATGKVTSFAIPEGVRDPRTAIVAPNGDLWFTAQFGNVVGRLSPGSGQFRIVQIPTKAARPYGLVLDSKGTPWFDLFGTNQIGTIDPATMKLRTFALPNDQARPRRIAVTTDDMVWYVDYMRGYIGRLDPRSGAVKEWQNPGGAASLPYAMTVDDQDRLWFVETGRQPNRLVGFDPKGERFFGLTDIPAGGSKENTVRHMTFDRTSGVIWFGTDAGTIGRATVAPRNKPIGD
jgi:virginiamycin B lyase